MIEAKINQVMKKVAFVTKDSTVGFGQNAYKAVSHDRVTEIVRPHFVEVGIIIVPKQREKGLSVDGKTQKGNDKIRFEAVYDVDFIDCEDTSKITVTVEAHAEGSDDKCSGKALSYAVKNAMLKVLMLETGENDEEGQKNSINEKQMAELNAIIKAQEEIRTRLRNYINASEKRDGRMVKITDIVKKTKNGRATIYKLLGEKETNFKTETLSKVCDYLDKKGA